MNYILPEEQSFSEVVNDSILKSKLDIKMKFLHKVYRFIVWSSVNKNKISLTLKGLVPFLVLWGLADSATFTQAIGNIGNIIGLTAQIATGAVTIYGLVRKIYVSFKK